MTVPIQKVQPGDLITAGFVNSLIDELVALDGRIAALESSLPGSKMMQIFAPLPSDTYHVGDELRIVGQGFGIPQLASVLFDQTLRVTSFKAGSNDSLLILDIPSFNIGQGKVVTIAVSNNTGAFAQASFNLLPAAQTVPSGALTMSQVTTPQQTVTPNAGFDLQYVVGTSAMLVDTYTFTPTFTNAPGWTAFLADSANNQLSSDFQIQPQSTTPVHVRVNVPQGASGTATLVVKFSSKNNPTSIKSVDSGVLALAVNGPVPGAEKIGISVGTVLNGAAGVILPDGQGVYPLPAAQSPCAFSYNVRLPAAAPAANYTVTAGLASDAVNWPANAVTIVSPPKDSTTGKSSFPAATGQKTAQVTVAAQTNAQPTTLTLTVSADADPVNTMGHLTLKIRAV